MFVRAPADRGRGTLQAKIGGTASLVFDKLRRLRHRALMRQAVAQLPGGGGVGKHQVVPIRVVNPGRPLFRNAVGIVEHDIVVDRRVIVRALGVIVVAAADQNACRRARHRVVTHHHAMRVMPHLDRGAADRVNQIVLHAARGMHVDALHEAATLRTDIVHAVADHIDLHAAVMAVDIDAGAARAGAGDIARDVVHVVMSDDVVRAGVVDAERPLGPAVPTAAIDLEAHDIDKAAAVVPGHHGGRIPGRHDARAPAGGRDVIDALGFVAAHHRLEAASIRAWRDVDGGAGQRDAGSALDGFEGQVFRAGIGV